MSAHQKTFRELPRVALIIETSRAYGRRIFEGIHDYLKGREPWLIISGPRSLTDPIPSWLEHWDGDGIIARLTDEQAIEQLRKSAVPLVLLKQGTGNLQPAEMPAVNDHQAIGREAAAHLLVRGYEHFAFAGIDGLPWSDERLQGYSDALSEAGHRPHRFPRQSIRTHGEPESLVGGDLSRFAPWLSELPRPCGVFAVDDFIGRAVLNACRAAELSVPEEIAVIGVDDEPCVSELGYPGLSSIVPDNVQVGRLAAARLDKLMRGETPDDGWPSPVKVPPAAVQTRESSDGQPVKDPDLVRALRVIREYACVGHNVFEIAKLVGVSTSTLQRKMRNERGQSVLEVIQEVRFKRAQQLLLETDLPVKQIATASGFNHQEHFISEFRKRFGHPPDAWRRRNG